jgi:Domain of unknown function (DUF5658)
LTPLLHSGKRFPRVASFLGSIQINQVSSITAGWRLRGTSADDREQSRSDQENAFHNKRIRVERRERHPLLADWRWSFRGRRRTLRRGTDSHRAHAILDWYHPSLLFFIVATYVLSGIDAVLTLTLLEFRVAEEANPLMHFLLARDIHLFAGVKALITGSGLVWLTAYSNQCLFTRLRVDRLIYALFATYTLLVVYEVRLLEIAESAGWPD